MRRLLLTTTFVLAFWMAGHAQTKISALPSGTPASGDIVPYVAAPATTAVTKKTTVLDLLGVLTPGFVLSANRHGDGTKFQLFTGSSAANDCAKFDASGNLISNGGTCAAAAPVQSVNSQTGAVSLTTTNIAEGTNLYYTNARADARITNAAVLAAIGFTPENAATSHVNTFNTRSGAVTLTSGDVIGALTFTPLDAASTTYALLAGRAGGQTLTGGTGSGESLTLISTSHATKGLIGISGLTSAFPALKRNSTGIDFRLGDDSAYAFIQASQLYLNNGYSGQLLLTPKSAGSAGIYASTSIDILNTSALGFVGGQGSAKDTTLSRQAAGVLQAGTTANNALGIFDASAYRVAGTKVLGAQCASIANATDAASAITQLNAVLACLRTHMVAP